MRATDQPQAGSPVRRRALLAAALATLGGAAAGGLTPGNLAGAVVEAPIEMNTGDATPQLNVATARTHLRADIANDRTLSLENNGSSTDANRGTLSAYLGAGTMPASTAMAAIRGVNGISDPGGAGISGEGPRGVFGTTNISAGAGVHGLARSVGGVGVRAEGTGGATALEVVGSANIGASARIGGNVFIDADGVGIDARDVEAGDDPVVHIRGLAAGAGILVAQDTDAGASPSARGFDAFPQAGILVDLTDHADGISRPPGVGISVRTAAGPAIRAESAQGTALDVYGPASFAGRVSAARLAGPGNAVPVFENAGAVTIPAGRSAVRVLDARVNSSTSVIATLQNAPGSGVLLNNVVVLEGKFRVRLNKPASRPAQVAYLIVGRP